MKPVLDLGLATISLEQNKNCDICKERSALTIEIEIGEEYEGPYYLFAVCLKCFVNFILVSLEDILDETIRS